MVASLLAVRAAVVKLALLIVGTALEQVHFGVKGAVGLHLIKDTVIMPERLDEFGVGLIKMDADNDMPDLSLICL